MSRGEGFFSFCDLHSGRPLTFKSREGSGVRRRNPCFSEHSDAEPQAGRHPLLMGSCPLAERESWKGREGHKDCCQVFPLAFSSLGCPGMCPGSGFLSSPEQSWALSNQLRTEYRRQDCAAEFSSRDAQHLSSPAPAPACLRGVTSAHRIELPF